MTQNLTQKSGQKYFWLIDKNFHVKFKLKKKKQKQNKNKSEVIKI